MRRFPASSSKLPCRNSEITGNFLCVKLPEIQNSSKFVDLLVLRKLCSNLKLQHGGDDGNNRKFKMADTTPKHDYQGIST
jgi:hypothetical protein